MGRILLERAVRDGRVPNPRITRFVTRGAPSRLRLLHREVQRWGTEVRAKYWRSLPLIVVGALSWWGGACYEIARSGPAVRRELSARSS